MRKQGAVFFRPCNSGRFMIQFKQENGGVIMDLTKLQSILKVGETIGVEFKRCGNGIEADVYETVCSSGNW